MAKLENTRKGAGDRSESRRSQGARPSPQETKAERKTTGAAT
jgi:hypothetical protein